MSESLITAAELPHKYVQVRDKRMACVESGSGPVVVFQHGNPTSSCLWRNIMPWMEDTCRCIAVDLIGMGRSDKLEDSGPGSYTLAEHQFWFDTALDTIVPGGSVVLVLHEWGSAPGFDWARRHPARVRGICYMEAIVCPLTWGDWPGSILTGRAREYCRGWPNQREVTVPGAHFLQEDSPHAIGAALREWYTTLV